MANPIHLSIGRPPADPTPPEAPGIAGAPDLEFDATAGETEEATARAAQWNSSLRPDNVFEWWLVEQIALASLRVERRQGEERALRGRAARRAGVCWEEDRTLAAERLAGGFAANPPLVRLQLRQTAQGCDLMIARWSALAGLLRAGVGWSEARLSMAHDLLGTPAVLRDAPSPLDGGDAARLALAESQVDELRQLKSESIGPLDALDRKSARKGQPAETDRATAAARRYENTCMRHLRWAFKMLKKTPAVVSARYDTSESAYRSVLRERGYHDDPPAEAREPKARVETPAPRAARPARLVAKSAAESEPTRPRQNRPFRERNEPTGKLGKPPSARRNGHAARVQL